MKGCYAAVAVLLAWLPQGAPAAENLTGAVRETVRKIAGFAGRDAVRLSFRNSSTLADAEWTQLRGAFQAEFRGDPSAPVEARVTLAENLTDYVVVAEVRRGDDRRVFLSSWRRGPAAAGGPAAPLTIGKKLVWEQDEPILDVAAAGDALFVLAPSQVTLCARDGGRWVARESAPVKGIQAWPRDPRGRLAIRDGELAAYVPGAVCRGVAASPLKLDCRPSQDAWPLGGDLSAHLAAGRNFFDGRVVAGALQKTVPPFYSAAATADRGVAVWLLAGLDGRTQMYGRGLEPLGPVGAWGSDITGVETHCGGGRQVLATRPTAAGEADAVEIYEIVNREARTAGTAVFPGPVTALWPAGEGTAVAVSRDPVTGRYYAFVLAISCGS